MLVILYCKYSAIALQFSDCYILLYLPTVGQLNFEDTKFSTFHRFLQNLENICILNFVILSLITACYLLIFEICPWNILFKVNFRQSSKFYILETKSPVYSHIKCLFAKIQSHTAMNLNYRAEANIIILDLFIYIYLVTQVLKDIQWDIFSACFLNILELRSYRFKDISVITWLIFYVFSA